MRRTALCAAMALIACTPAALADPPTTVQVDSHITPVIRPFTSKTSSANLTVNLTFSGANGTQAATLKQVVLKFSYGAHLNGQFFPSCSADQIQNHEACPKGSVIGTGTGLGVVGGDTDNPAKEFIVLTLYNGPKGKSITFRIRDAGGQPAPIDVSFDAPLKTFSGGTYNYQLTANVPDILQRVAGLPISINYLRVKVGATRVVKGHKRGYIETLICPPGALVPLQGDFAFVDDNPFHIDTYIHCG